MKVHIFTDGASRGNPGPGGYGIVMIYGDKIKEISAGYRYTTNNRMELLAVIVALEHLKINGLEVEVYSDSKYVVDSISKGWIWNWAKKGFKDKKNEDLWRRFLALYPKNKIKMNWVKGHAQNKYNNRCDALATAAADGSSLLADTEFERSNTGQSLL